MTGHADRRPRVLVLLGTAMMPPFIDEIGELSRAGKYPRPWLLDLDADLTLLDQRFLTGPPSWRLALYRRLPIWAAQAIEAFRVRRDYDVVFAWGAEPIAMSFALLLKLARSKVPFVTLFSWISPPKKAYFIRATRSYITRMVLPPPTQREFAVRKLGVPPEKAMCIPWSVDTEFWQDPENSDTDMICAVGREMRDYETLAKALEGTGIRCHIAGRLVPGKNDRWRRVLGDSGEKAELPPNITIGPRKPEELRGLYRRSRFVVLPLLPSDTDNGITTMLEAWAMSRPVICSRIQGQRGAFTDGETGLFVPPLDTAALRDAIVGLWNQPQRAADMGAEGRRRVEKHHQVSRFAEQISQVLREVAAAGPRAQR